MARLSLHAEFALFVEHTVVPALRSVQFPVGEVKDPLYLKFLAAAFVPLVVVFLFVAIARGHLIYYRFLGLYIILFLVSVASGWFNFKLVKSDAGAFALGAALPKKKMERALISLDATVFSHEGVPVEAVLHHVLAALLLAAVHFALQRPGLPSRFVGSGSTYLRLWGFGTQIS